MLLTIRFLAIVFTAIALIAPGAHLYELANKIALPQDHYFIVQKIYDGWWMAGLALPAAFIANVALAILARHDSVIMWLALIAAGLIVLNLVIFFIWTNPANLATQNWRVQPGNWRELRQSWEYSHAVNAVVILLALCASTLAALRGR